MIDKTKLLTDIREFCRYSNDLADLLERLGATELLYFGGESDWQGYLDVDVLLSDGRVFSYMYNYGSCSGCDEWDSLNHNGEKIQEAMERESTIFSTIESYRLWAVNVRGTEG